MENWIWYWAIVFNPFSTIKGTIPFVYQYSFIITKLPGGWSDKKTNKPFKTLGYLQVDH